MAIRGVAFDLDYTLAVPNRDRKTLLSEAVAAADAPPITRADYLEAHRNNLTTETREPIFADLLSKHDDRNTDPSALATAYREAISDSIAPIPDAERLVTELRCDYRVGLLTNGPVRAQRSKLETLEWNCLFDTSLVTGELPAGKPDSAAFGALIDELGTRPEETVYIGDTPRDDIMGAKEAGLVPIQVLFEEGPEKDPRAFAYIERDALVDELPRLLAAM
ncbi:HAD family hydrolase [Haloferacaceae archaeon DSL9]